MESKAASYWGQLLAGLLALTSLGPHGHKGRLAMLWTLCII